MSPPSSLLALLPHIVETPVFLSLSFSFYLSPLSPSLPLLLLVFLDRVFSGIILRHTHDRVHRTSHQKPQSHDCFEPSTCSPIGSAWPKRARGDECAPRSKVGSLFSQPSQPAPPIRDADFFAEHPSYSENPGTKVLFHDARSRFVWTLEDPIPLITDLTLAQANPAMTELVDKSLKRFGRLLIDELDDDDDDARWDVYDVATLVANAKRTFQKQTEEYKLVMTSGHGNARYNFDYNPAYMTWQGLYAEDLPAGRPPKVAFVVTPMVLNDGFTNSNDEPVEYTDKPLFMAPLAVILGGHHERELAALKALESRAQPSGQRPSGRVLFLVGAGGAASLSSSAGGCAM